MRCPTNQTYHASIPAVQRWSPPEQSTVRSINLYIRKRYGPQPAVAMGLRGGKPVRSFCRRIRCVRNARGRGYLQKQRWWIMWFRTEEIRRCSGIGVTGRRCANSVMIRKPGKRTGGRSMGTNIVLAYIT